MTTDLLLSLLSSAVQSHHLPFARPVALTSDSTTSAGPLFRLEGSDEVNFPELLAVIHRLPPVSGMVLIIEKGTRLFAEAMDAIDVRLLPLLRWLHSSAPRIRPVTAVEAVSSVHALHQFVVVYPSETERRFQQAKERLQGSVWAFHGSRSESWHCILRTGLKNLTSVSTRPLPQESDCPLPFSVLTPPSLPFLLPSATLRFLALFC